MVTIYVDNSKECNGDYSLFVSFEYDQKIVDTIRAMPTRYWNKNSKNWEIPAKHLSMLVKNLSKHTIKIIGKINELDKPKQPVEVNTPKDFVFKTKPFNHQIDGFNYGLTHNKWLLGDEQGLGKTKQVIDIAIAKKLEFGYKHCLIVCGVNGLKWNWQKEIDTHSDESCWILGQRQKKNKLVIGTTNDKIADVENIPNMSEYFIITNVESLRNDDIQTKLGAYCKSGEISIVAIDEIHKCKNPSSQQGKGILKLQPEIRIAMSGTPLMNSPLDLYIVLKWLGYEKHAFYAFKNHHCIFGGYGGYEILGYKNMDDIQDTLSEMMLRRKKEDVLDLPEKIYIDEFVEMTGPQEQIYKEVSATIKADIDRIACTNNPLAELIRLRQATGYTGILSSKILQSAKLDRLEELVEESIANNKKVVIFSNWTQITEPAYDRLSSKYTGLVITGGTNDTERQQNVDKFQNNPNINFIIGTIGSMGTGITLTAGTVVIFLDEPWTMANKEQAIDRCHRIGTKSNITIYTIMCKNTIDERIHTIVERKGAMSDALIDGKIIGNKTELLNYLLS